VDKRFDALGFLEFIRGVKNGGNIGAEGDEAKAGNREVGEWRCERLRGFGEIWECGLCRP
jgi:hypothetical protein